MRLANVLTSVFAMSIVLGSSAAAVAGTVRVQDPAGDGQKGHRLDIVSVKVDNRDHAIVVTTKLVRIAHGELDVALWARGDGKKTVSAVTSVHRASGDTNRLRTADGVQQCKGLKVSWRETSESVRVSVPSRCFRGGDYGAIKGAVLTTIAGRVVDIAPSVPGRSRWTKWVGRG